MEVPPGIPRVACVQKPGGGGVVVQMVRLVNFVPESRLMYKNIQTLPETGINDSFEEMEPEFSFGIFCLEKEDYLSKCIFR